MRGDFCTVLYYADIADFSQSGLPKLKEDFYFQLDYIFQHVSVLGGASPGVCTENSTHQSQQV